MKARHWIRGALGIALIVWFLFYTEQGQTLRDVSPW